MLLQGFEPMTFRCMYTLYSTYGSGNYLFVWESMDYERPAFYQPVIWSKYNSLLIQCSSLTFHYKTDVRRWNRQKMYDVRRDMIGKRQGGLLLSYRLETRWEMRSSGFHFYLGISQRVSATLLLKRSPIFFWHFPKSCQYPLGTAQMVSNSLKTHFLTCLGINVGNTFIFPMKQ